MAKSRAMGVATLLRLATVLGAALALLLLLPVARAEAPARVIVLTDIGADPDDTQSLVRLLLYANDIDMRALVATTSVYQRKAPRPGDIHRLLERYAAVEATLRLHDRRYPRAAVLRTRIAAGQAGYGLEATGPGRDSRAPISSCANWTGPTRGRFGSRSGRRQHPGASTAENQPIKAR